MNAKSGAVEEVMKAADQLAYQVERLLDGPPNGAHWHLRHYLSQWANVQQALDEYRKVHWSSK